MLRNQQTCGESLLRTSAQEDSADAPRIPGSDCSFDESGRPAIMRAIADHQRAKGGKKTGRPESTVTLKAKLLGISPKTYWRHGFHKRPMTLLAMQCMLNEIRRMAARAGR